MINKCNEDRNDIIKEIKEALKVGNMKSQNDLYNLRIDLIKLGYDFTAEYMDEEENDFLNLLELAKQ